MQVGWRYLFFCLFCFCSQVIPLHPCIYKRKTNYYFLIIIFLRNSSEQHTEVVGLLFQSKGEPASRKLIGSKFSFELFKTLTYLWNLFKFYHLFGKQKWSSQLWSNSCKETPRKNVRLQCDLNPFIWLLFAVLYNFCIFSHFHHYLAVRWKQPLIYSFSSNMFNINFLWITWAPSNIECLLVFQSLTAAIAFFYSLKLALEWQLLILVRKCFCGTLCFRLPEFSLCASVHTPGEGCPLSNSLLEGWGVDVSWTKSVTQLSILFWTVLKILFF